MKTIQHQFLQYKIPVSESAGEVSAELIMPEAAIAILTLAHGAGSDMYHTFLQDLSVALAENRIATMRFNFPYTEKHKRVPDRAPVATATVLAVANMVHQNFPNMPVFLSGKSFGGRMSSQLLSTTSPEWIKGIIFYGFPLHAPGTPSVERAEHLKDVRVPKLFLQGTKDALAHMDLMEQVAATLPDATMVKLEGADHSFKAGKKPTSGILISATLEWIKKVLNG